jgi:isoleucyl-tRNA synthetase
VISDELNVKQVWFDAKESDLAVFNGKPNFSRLGPRLGPLVKKAAAVIQKLDAESLSNLLDGKTVPIQVEGQAVDLSSDDVIVERKPKEGLVVASQNNLVVALETDLTQELMREGLAREFVNKIQSMRKTADLDVTQRIRITYCGDDSIREAVEEYKGYIEAETLCLDSVYSKDLPVETSAWDLNGHSCSIRIDKA